MTDSRSQIPKAPPPPPEPPEAKGTKARPTMRSEERPIGRSIIGSGAPPKH